MTRAGADERARGIRGDRHRVAHLRHAFDIAVRHGGDARHQLRILPKFLQVVIEPLDDLLVTAICRRL